MEAPRKLFSVSFNRVFSVIGAGRYLGPTLAWQQLGPHGGAQNIPQSTVKLAGLDCSPIHVTGHWMGLNHFYLAVIFVFFDLWSWNGTKFAPLVKQAKQERCPQS